MASFETKFSVGDTMYRKDLDYPYAVIVARITANISSSGTAITYSGNRADRPSDGSYESVSDHNAVTFPEWKNHHIAACSAKLAEIAARAEVARFKL